MQNIENLKNSCHLWNAMPTILKDFKKIVIKLVREKENEWVNEWVNECMNESSACWFVSQNAWKAGLGQIKTRNLECLPGLACG